MSSAVPIDDIKKFTEYCMGKKIVCATKPSEHWVVAKFYWEGCASIDAESLAVFCKRVCSSDVILDIGANWGYYTLLAGAIAPHAKIIAFEPHPFWFEQLKRNVIINNFKNVRVERLAVGEMAGSAPFYIDNQHPSTSSMVKEFTRDEHTTKIITEVVCIDSFVKQNKIDKISLIKIDVEAYESAVLSGGKSVLQTHRPDIICEVLPDEGMGYREANRKAIQTIVTELGYQAYWMSNTGLVREEIIQGHYPLANYLLTTCEE
jgi:FkbM family methyltransferase